MSNRERIKELRKHSEALRLLMKRLRFDLLQVQLSLRTLQGNEYACARIAGQLSHPLNTERPKRAKKASKP